MPEDRWVGRQRIEYVGPKVTETLEAETAHPPANDDTWYGQAASSDHQRISGKPCGRDYPRITQRVGVPHDEYPVANLSGRRRQHGFELPLLLIEPLLGSPPRAPAHAAGLHQDQSARSSASSSLPTPTWPKPWMLHSVGSSGRSQLPKYMPPSLAGSTARRRARCAHPTTGRGRCLWRVPQSARVRWLAPARRRVSRSSVQAGRPELLNHQERAQPPAGRGPWCPPRHTANSLRIPLFVALRPAVSSGGHCDRMGQ